MVTHINTVSFQGIDLDDVEIQVHFGSGKVGINIVGLPDKAIKESCERVSAAFSSIGLALPAKKITVNLSPADIVKEGSHYDLGIALGILCEMEVIPKSKQNSLKDFLVLGELSLDGTLSSVNGILPAAVGAVARDKAIICPQKNGSEAVWASEDLLIIAANNLLELIEYFRNDTDITKPQLKFKEKISKYPDLKDVKGQHVAKRALEVAAAGGHNLLMIGPPGSGKSMLATRLPGLLPELTLAETLEISMIKSISGLLKDGELDTTRPYRDPHSSCSIAAMTGGGKNAKPGEITLAHNGVLFLDELPEYPASVLDSLRQPLESGTVTVSRVNAHVTYPARFQLIAAMNPCKCGYLGNAKRECKKAPICGKDYQAKISGPFMDRIDICVEVPTVDIFYDEDSAIVESSTVVAERVKQARQVQTERYKNYKISTNAKADNEVLMQNVNLNDDLKLYIKTAAKKLDLTMRGYNRLLRVARTIADLDHKKDIEKHHLNEALNYRQHINLIAA